MFSVGLTAKDIMKSPVITVKTTMSVEELADMFMGEMISGALVLDQRKKPIGVVSTHDIVRNEPRREHIISEKVASDYILLAWEPQFSSEELTGYHLEESETLLVEDIMTPFIYKVDAETPVEEIADIMVCGRIHRLFVCCQENIEGVVTTRDMLNCYLNSSRSGSSVA